MTRARSKADAPKLPRGLVNIELALSQAAERIENKCRLGFGDNYDSNNAFQMRRAINAIRFLKGDIEPL